MTTVRYAPGTFALTAEGHAGAGRAGEDLVCAGVSTLCWTLKRAAEAVPGANAAAALEAGTPRFSLRCDPEPEAAGTCAAVLATAAAGFRLLAERFPEHVAMEEET